MRDGVLRHRRHPRRGRGDRAEPRRAGHHLAGRRWPRSPWPSRRSATTAARRSRRCADRLHDELEAAGVEVLLDDRGERPGVMFADLELIGIPHRVTIGDRGLKEGKVEYQARRETAATPVPVAEIAAFIKGRLGNDMTPVSDTATRMARLARGRCCVPRRRRCGAAHRRRAGRRAARAIGRVAALQRAIADNPVPEPIYATKRPGVRALARRDVATRSRRRFPDDRERSEFLATVHYEATRAGPRSATGARRDPAREQFPQVRGLDRRRARLHAGDAVLGEADRHAGPEPVPPAHEPALRLRRSCATTSTSRTATSIARSAATTAASGGPNTRRR